MLIDRLGSQSRIEICAPAWASSVARITDAVDFPAPPFGDATVTMGIFLTRFVSKPGLALHPVPVNIGSMVRPDNCGNPVLILTGSSGLSGQRMNLIS